MASSSVTPVTVQPHDCAVLASNSSEELCDKLEAHYPPEAGLFPKKELRAIVLESDWTAENVCTWLRWFNAATWNEFYDSVCFLYDAVVDNNDFSFVSLLEDQLPCDPTETCEHMLHVCYANEPLTLRLWYFTPQNLPAPHCKFVTVNFLGVEEPSWSDGVKTLPLFEGIEKMMRRTCRSCTSDDSSSDESSVSSSGSETEDVEDTNYFFGRCIVQ